MTDKRKTYSFELKLAAVTAVLDEGNTYSEVVVAFDVASKATLRKWVYIYRDIGAQGLRDLKRGRPAGWKSCAPIDIPFACGLKTENERLCRKLLDGPENWMS